MSRTCDEKNLKKMAMLRTFIDGTESFLLEHGEEALSVRKLCQALHYNSTLLYYYFETLDHLLFYVIVKKTTPLFHFLDEIQAASLSPWDAVIKAVEAFVYEVFKNPHDYYRLFFGPCSIRLTETIRILNAAYCEREQVDVRALPFYRLPDGEYAMPHVDRCVEGGYIGIHFSDRITEMFEIFLKGMLAKSLASPSEDTCREAARRTYEYTRIFIERHRTPVGLPL